MDTQFSHAQTLVRRKRNEIHDLFFDDGTWHIDPNDLHHEATRYFHSIFSKDSSPSHSSFEVQSIPQLNEDENLALSAHVTIDEVRIAVMGIKSFKAPGLDGFQPFFYKQYWPIVGLISGNLLEMPSCMALLIRASLKPCLFLFLKWKIQII